MLVNPYNYGNIKLKKQNFNNSTVNNSDNNLNSNEINFNLKENRFVNKSTPDKYFEQKILNAKPQDLVTMLYEGLIRFIKQAIIALELNDYEKVNNNSIRAQAIVAELRATLDMDIDTSNEIDRLYVFIFDKLQEGNIKKEFKPLEDALDISESMLQMWKELLERL